MTGFPPAPRHGDEIDVVVEAFASVIGGRSATYVSSPLTTGSRAFEWHRQNGSPGDQASFVEDVVEPNRREAADFVRTLRQRIGSLVVDPTAMSDLRGWEQDDYRVFWGRVIERYCSRVILRDGWQFSSGCSYEYLVARRARAETLTEHGQPLPEMSALRLLREAIAETEVHGVSAAFLRSVHDALAQSAGEARHR